MPLDFAEKTRIRRWLGQAQAWPQGPQTPTLYCINACDFMLQVEFVEFVGQGCCVSQSCWHVREPSVPRHARPEAQCACSQLSPTFCVPTASHVATVCCEL